MVAPASVRRRRAAALVLVALGASAAARSVPPVVTEEMMLVETDALARAVSEARKVRVVGGWERRLIGKAEARAAAATIVRGDLADALPDTAADARVFQRLGLLAAGARYVDLVVDAVARDPVGFYDPVTRRLSVPSYIPLGEQRSLLAHEIAHAVQDQRVGLRRFLKIASDGRRGLSFDGELARQAVVEGDAAVLALEAVDPKASFPTPFELGDVGRRARGGGLSGARDTPDFLRALLAFPFVDGFAFVARARGRATWSAVDAIWARPPDSTTQILHPDKYDRRQAPLAIELPSLPLMGDGSGLARTDTFGELLLRLWLASSPAVPVAVAERAAAGWKGDRMAIYVAGATAPVFGPAPAPALEPPPVAVPGDAGTSDGKDAGAGGAPGASLAWLTAWDTDADADDFLQTAAARLAALAGATGAAGTVDTGERPAVWAARADDTIFAIQRRGIWVALLLGAPAPALPSLTTLLDGAAPRRGKTRREEPRREEPRRQETRRKSD